VWLLRAQTLAGMRTVEVAVDNAQVLAHLSRPTGLAQETV